MHILRHVDLTKVFFLDIETVPGYGDHDALPAADRSLWETFSTRRHAPEVADGRTPAELYEKAGLYPEFGKVVCISVGFFRPLKDETLEFRVKSFADDDEGAVLRGFAYLLARHAPSSHEYRPKLDTATKDGYYLCAHNGREFDYGYLGRRLLVRGLSLPPLLDTAGHKPWELPHLLDTLDLWKFGDFHARISLPLLAGLFGIPSPKDDLAGAQVGHTYWQEKDLRRIVTYCERDVVTTARVFLHYTGQQALWPEVQLTHTPWPAMTRMHVV